uniref:X-ray repair cross complementing 1 n=1 Tax=Myotis lucifugus TaxID=59463 RepID=G1Q9S0_MYOLU
MPEIRLRHVVSCSSQDSTHCADNLLKADTYRKWRAAKAGEKTISVVLQVTLPPPHLLVSAGVGGSGNGFLEVRLGLVCLGSTTPAQGSEVLLVTSSFMSPSESRSGSNPNRVRLFGPEKLVRGAAEKRWDRVKIVCSQPYSKAPASGLAFDKASHFDEESDLLQNSKQTNKKQYGGGRPKEKAQCVGVFKGEKRFTRLNREPAGWRSPSWGQPGVCPEEVQVGSACCGRQEVAGKRGWGSRSHGRLWSWGRTGSDLRPMDRKERTASAWPGQGSVQLHRPHIYSSGIQTPPAAGNRGRFGRGRGRLCRGAGVSRPGCRWGPRELGEFFSWSVSSLRTINIVSRSLKLYFLYAFSQRETDFDSQRGTLFLIFFFFLKWGISSARGGRAAKGSSGLSPVPQGTGHPVCLRPDSFPRYLMAGPDSSSEDEGGPHSGSSGDEAPQLPQKPPQTKTKAPQAAGSSSPQTASTPEETKPASPGSQEDTHTEGEWSEGQDNGAEDSEDTEDELRRVAEQKERRQPPGQGENGEDPYAGSTDENTDNESPPESPDLPIPELPDFFQGKHFFLYGEFPGDERRTLSRYVTAFNGELEDYMSDRVQFVITAQEWDPSFEEALMDNPSLVFVRPRWIYSCNEPHQLYGVVPQA